MSDTVEMPRSELVNRLLAIKRGCVDGDAVQRLEDLIRCISPDLLTAEQKLEAIREALWSAESDGKVVEDIHTILRINSMKQSQQHRGEIKCVNKP